MSGRQRGNIRETNGSVGSSDSDSDSLINDIDMDDEDDDFLNSTEPGINDFHSKHNEEKRAMSKIDNADDEF